MTPRGGAGALVVLELEVVPGLCQMASTLLLAVVVQVLLLSPS